MSVRKIGDDWQAVLERSYHHLCRSVRPEAFFSWLRSKGVLTRDDQEEVENKYVTTVMKSGHLIDIIKSKGQKGFVAFMEVVEYVYPDTYNLLTGKQPRKSPPEFEPNASISDSVVRERRGPALSAEILGQMGDLVNVLSQANAYKKEELAKLQTYVRQLQEENQTMCDENRSILLKFKDTQEEIEQLKQKLNATLLKHEHDTKERKLLSNECDRLRELKDKYVDENQKLRFERDELDCKMLQLTGQEIQQSQTCKIPPVLSKLEQLRQENQQLLLERTKLLTRLAEFQEQLQGETRHDVFSSNKNNQSDLTLTINTEEDPQTLTKDQLALKLTEWQNKYLMLQERYDHVLANLEEVKTERNQVCHQLEDLQSMYEKEREENMRLVADCDKYHDRFCNMESQMVLLRREIDQLQSCAVATPVTENESRDASVVTNGNYEMTKDVLQLTTEKSRSLTSAKCVCSEPSIENPTARHIKIIPQTPGCCPNIQRQVVINKIQKQTSVSNI